MTGVKHRVTLTSVTTPGYTPQSAAVTPDPTSHPPKKRPVGLIVAAAAAGVVVLIAAAVAITVAATRSKPSAVTAAATPVGQAAPTTPAAQATTAVPAPPPLDDSAACVMLVPTAQAAADVVIALANQPDGSTVDQTKLANAISNFASIEDVAPAELKPDIETQLLTLRDIDAIFHGAPNRTLAFDDFKASGLRIAARCAPYATK